jgi:hypothetical protein
MRKSHAQLREELTQDVLVRELRSDFEQVPDHRAPNVVYTLGDILMSAYALFALKYPSLLCFEQQTKAEVGNLENLFGLPGVCSDAQMRRVLDEVSPDHLQGLFSKRFGHLKRTGLLGDYRFLRKYFLVSIDGVEYFNSQQIHCNKCLEKHHRSGEVSYSHSMLGAVLVHPDERAVFPLGSEAIQKQDGENKNDCEINASKRLQARLFADYKNLPMVVIEDALYANEPHIEQVLSNGWDYIINVKPGSHEILFRHFEERKKRGQVNSLTLDEAGTQHRFYWMNNVPLNGQGNVRVNFLYYEEHTPKGKIKRFSWVTSLRLRSSTVYHIMRGGRARWKIENETFNTLKNQGYNFEHNYGHGYKHLCNVLALIMLLAFLIDQIVQATSTVFQTVWSEVKTKARIWEYMRALFMTSVIPSFKELFVIIAEAYEVQLE